MDVGLTEQDFCKALEEELVRSMRAEGGATTIHAIAHGVWRIPDGDNLRMLEQFEAAGGHLGDRRERAEA